MLSHCPVEGLNLSIELKGKGLFMMQQENKPRKAPTMPPKQTYDLATPLAHGLGKLTF